MWKNTWLKELAGKYGLEKGKSIIVEERSLLKDYTYITREIRQEQQKSVQAWTLFLLRKESGSKGALLRSVPSGILSLL